MRASCRVGARRCANFETGDRVPVASYDPRMRVAGCPRSEDRPARPVQSAGPALRHGEFARVRTSGPLGR